MKLAISPIRNANRRYFIGGSDARIIIGDDEAALMRLWREKRGEAEPEDLSGKPHRRARGRDGAPQSAVVRTQPGEARPAPAHNAYLWFLTVSGFRRRTPGPPPFSSMNWTPARLSTASIFASDVASPAYRPTSILVIVFRWRPVASARSRTVQFRAALAILTCAFVTAKNLCYCHMCQRHNGTIFWRLSCHKT